MQKQGERNVHLSGLVLTLPAKRPVNFGKNRHTVYGFTFSLEQLSLCLDCIFRSYHSLVPIAASTGSCFFGFNLSLILRGPLVAQNTPNFPFVGLVTIFRQYMCVLEVVFETGIGNSGCTFLVNFGQLIGTAN